MELQSICFIIGVLRADWMGGRNARWALSIFLRVDGMLDEWIDGFEYIEGGRIYVCCMGSGW